MSDIQALRDYLAAEVMGWLKRWQASSGGNLFGPAFDTEQEAKQSEKMAYAAPVWWSDSPFSWRSEDGHEDTYRPGVVVECMDWQPDTDANQALMLLAKVDARAILFYERERLSEPRGWFCVFRTQPEPCSGSADTLPLAICRAVKAWREAQDA